MLSASPKASNPGPRLALEAGTRTFIRSVRLQPHHRPCATGLINGAHYFERAITVFARRHRLAASAYGLAKIAELALERSQRNRHGIRRPRCDVLLDWRWLPRIVLDIPARELVAGDHGRALGPVDLDALGVSRPKCRGCLDHASRARAVLHERRDHIFRFNLVKRGQLPITENLGNPARQPQQY